MINNTKLKFCPPGIFIGGKIMGNNPAKEKVSDNDSESEGSGGESNLYVQHSKDDAERLGSSAPGEEGKEGASGSNDEDSGGEEGGDLQLENKEDTGSISSGEGLVGLGHSSSSESEDEEEEKITEIVEEDDDEDVIRPAPRNVQDKEDEEDEEEGGDDPVEEIQPPRRSSIQRNQSAGSFYSNIPIPNPSPEFFNMRTSILSFINMVVVAYMLNGNMSGLASFLTFISGLVGQYAFNFYIMPRIREHVMNNPRLQMYIGPIVGTNRPARRTQLAYQMRGVTEVNIAASAMNVLFSGLSSIVTARSLDLGLLSGAGSFAVYYYFINRLMHMVAHYIDNGSDELRERIIAALGMLGSGIRDRVGVHVVLRWVRESISPSQYPAPARPGEAVRRQELQERGAEIMSTVVGALVFLANFSGASIHWAAIYGSFAWGGTRLPLFAYMGLMRMAHQYDIRRRFMAQGNYNTRDLAVALVTEGSAIPTIGGDVLASIGIIGGRLLGIMKWMPLILISKALPASGQKMLLSVIGTNVAASTINLAYAVDATLNPEVPPEDVINHVHDNSPVTSFKRVLFFEFWIFMFYMVAAITTIALFKRYDVLTSSQSFDALYAGLTIFGVVLMLITSLLIYSNIDSLAQKAERNCCVRPLLRSSCFKAWWGYTGGSEGKTPEEIEGNRIAQGRIEAIVAEESNIGIRRTIRDNITSNRVNNRQRDIAPDPITDQRRIIRLQDGTNMILALVGDATQIDPNANFLQYTVTEPEQDTNALHIREVRISTVYDDNYTLIMSDGRSIIRNGNNIRIRNADGEETYNSDTAPSHGPQVDLQELVNNMMEDPNLSTPVRQTDTSFMNPPWDIRRQASTHTNPDESDSEEDGWQDWDEEMEWDGSGVQQHTAEGEEEEEDTEEERADESSPLLGEQGSRNTLQYVNPHPRFSINGEGESDEEEATQRSSSVLQRIRNMARNNQEDEDRFPLLLGRDEDPQNFVASIPTTGGSDSGGGDGPANQATSTDKSVALYSPLIMHEYFQDSTPEVFDIFEKPYEVLLELDNDEIEMFEESEENSKEEMAQMRDTIEPEIKVKEVYDYENDGPIKPKEKGKEKFSDDFEDLHKTGPINPKIYDFFDPLEDPTKSKRFGDPDECKYELFGYCTDNLSTQLMGAFMIAPMMVMSSR